MISSILRQLDRQSVAVEMSIGDRMRVYVGQAEFVVDEQLGPVLRICVEDSTGPFELMLQADAWDGEISSGHAHGCAHSVKLQFPPAEAA